MTSQSRHIEVYEKINESAEWTRLKLAVDSLEHTISLLSIATCESLQRYGNLYLRPRLDIKEQGTKPKLLYKPEQ